jgi:hypothetical protein
MRLSKLKNVVPQSVIVHAWCRADKRFEKIGQATLHQEHH